MALVGFQQDPYGAPGAGYFHGSSGPPVYAYHPELANQLSSGAPPAPGLIQPSVEMQQAAAPGPDMRTAGLGAFATTDQRLAAGGGAPWLDNQLAQMSDASGGQKPPEAKGAPAIGGGPQLGTGEAAPQNIGQAASQLNDQQLAQAMLKEQRAKPVTTKAHYQPTTKEIGVTEQGAPLSEENRARMEDSYWGGVSGAQNAGDAEAQRLHAAASANMVDAVAQQKQIERQQNIANDTNGLVQTDKSDLLRYRQELEQSQKDFNPNRLFSGPAGTVAGIGAAIFRAMGAYASARGHLGANPAGDVIDAAIDRDIAQQRQAIESGKSNSNNALSRLQEHYGDLNQATSALRLLQHSYADTQQQFLANATGIPQVIAKTQQDIAGKEALYAKEMNSFEQAAYGKHQAKVAEKYVPTTTSGGPPSVDKLLERGSKMAGTAHTKAETDKLESEAKNPKEPPGVAKAREDEAQLASVEENLKAIQGYYSKSGPLSPAERADLKSRRARAGLEASKPLTGNGRYTPLEDEKYATAVGSGGNASDMFGTSSAALGSLMEQVAKKREFLRGRIASGQGITADPAAEIQDVP